MIEFWNEQSLLNRITLSYFQNIIYFKEIAKEIGLFKVDDMSIQISRFGRLVIAYNSPTDDDRVLKFTELVKQDIFKLF